MLRTCMTVSIILFLFSGCSTNPQKVRGTADKHLYSKSVLFQLPANGEDERKELLNPSGELWIGKEIMTYITPDRTIILNRKDGILTGILHRSKKYIQKNLPVQLEDVFEGDLMRKMKSYPWLGEVSKTDLTKTILGKSCTEYEVTSWQEKGTDKMYEQVIQVWASDDFDVDFGLYGEFWELTRMLFGRGPSYREELKKIRGLQLMLKTKGRDGNYFLDETQEVTWRVPPEGTYEVPEGYERVEFVSEKDL